MGSPAGDTGARGRPRARSSARPADGGTPGPGGGRHRGATPSLRDRLRAVGRSGGGALAVAGAVLVLGLVGAVFSSTTQNPPNVYTAAALDAYVPTAVTATRTSSTTCLVSWTPVASPPAGLTYDVTNGSGTTVVTGASGTSATATVPVTAVTPTVKARLGTWVSTASTAAASACLGWPDAPGSLVLTPSDGAVAAGWTAPAANGGTLASYTATISPAPSSGSATCTATVPTTSCSWSNLSNGLTYTVSVTATSDVGTGPAATATAIPYPSTLMSGAGLRLWLDGAQTSTLFTGSGCTGAVTTTGQTVGCWQDRSGQGNHLTQGTSTQRPTTSMVAGRLVPTFDGTNDWLSRDSTTLPTGTSSSTTFVAAATTATPATAGEQELTWQGTGTSTGSARYLYKPGSSAQLATTAYGTTDAQGGAISAGTGFVAVSDFTAGTSYGTRLNGLARSARTVAHSTVGSYFELSYSGVPWQGPVEEVVVLASSVTDAEARTVEEYLSRKWSVTITPGRPTAVAATPSTTADGTATVSWTSPYDGGSAITSYTVTGTPADSTAATVSFSCVSSPCTVPGFTDGASYTVTVTANNAVGAGPASSGVLLTTYPATVMTSGTTRLWLDGADGATLFTSAGCTGATTTSGAFGCWKDKSAQGNDATMTTASQQATVSTLNSRTAPLFDGSNDYFSLAVATLPTGTTPSTQWVVAVQEDTTPTSSDFRHVVGWGAAAVGGGRVIEKGSGSSTVYLDTYGSWSTSSATKSWPVGTGALVDGTVTATSITSNVNGATNFAQSYANSTGTSAGAAVGATGWNTGAGVWKGRIAEVVVTNTAATAAQNRVMQEYLARKWGVAITPAAPQSLSATPSTTSDGTVTVTWSAPSWNGGTAVTGYTVTASPSDGTLSTVTQSCASSPCTVGGLTNGVTYTVSVTATNSVGTSASSSSATVVPYPAGTVMTTSALRLWLDGADTSTMFQSNTCTGATATTVGQTVGCWADKSGQADNALQSTAAARPTLTAVASRPVPGFDGSNDTMALTVAKLPTGTTPSTTAVVARLTGTPGYRNLLSWGALGNGQARAQYLDSGPVKADTYLAPAPAASTGSISQNQLFQATFGYTSTGSTVTLDGGAAVSSSGAVSTGSTFAYFGGAPSMTYWWQGPIPEVVVLSTTLSPTQQRTLDEYLARKWGNVSVADAPTGVTAAPSTTTNGAADVAWTAPLWNGGATITSYTVTATPADGTVATTTQTCSSSPCTLTGLTNGAQYTVAVQAVNSAGSGTAGTAASTVTPYPAATFASNALAIWLDGADTSSLYSDTGCTTAAGTSVGSAVACWKDRSGNARNAVAGANAAVGSTLDGKATVAFNGTSQLLAPRPVSGDMTLFAVPRTSQSQGVLTDKWWNGGTVFDADVVAANPGDWGLTVVGGAAAFGTGTGDQTAHGVAAVNNGAGHVIVGRRVQSTGALEASSDGGARGTATSPTTTALTGPTSVYLGKSNGGKTYVGDIAEVLALGAAASRTDERTVVEYLSRKWGFSITPAAPSAVTVTGADSQATVTWTAPWNGYSAITGSTVTATPVDGSLPTRTASCASSPCTVTSLTNGATYAFTVTATNAVGTGPASTAVSASPYPATLFAAADLKVWLDAQYASALSTAADCSGSGAASGVVGCWKDRSGNGWNAPAASGASGATLTSSAINGRTALRFSKSSATAYRVTSAGVGAVGSADRSLFAVGVGRTTTSSAGTGYAGVVAAFNTNWTGGLLTKSTGGNTTVNWLQSDAYEQSATPAGAYAGETITSGSPFLASSVLSSSGGTLTNAVALNGAGTTTNGTVAGSWMSYADSFQLGSADTNIAQSYAYPLDGDIGEVLVFDRALSASERRTVEEYLARHWGQTIAPAAPTLSTVTKPATGQLTATWSAPTGWNGGALVTSYTATAAAAGQTTRTCSTAGTSCTIGSLTAGVTYTVTVAAQNTVGPGANSNALTGTP